MKPQLYEQLSVIEDRHWWHQSRGALVAYYIRKMKLGRDAWILDVGCGTGGTTRLLERYGRVIGVDRSEIALKYAKDKASKTVFVQADANHIGQLFSPGRFDLITFFNVLYHQWVQDDLQVLAGVTKLLRPGGYVLLTEPAYRILMRRHDVLGMGKTRYKLSDFRRYFAEIGIDYRWGRYFNAIAFPLCLVAALKSKLLGDAVSDRVEVKELLIPPRAVNSAMRLFMEMERRLYTWIPLPIGVTLLVVGQRRFE